MERIDADAVEKIRDDKYVVFKRADMLAVTDGYVTFETGAALADAVVIRRQDLFASPALGAYAQCIAIVARLTVDDSIRKQLMVVADYFHQQSMVAADEGWKTPD